MFGSSKMSCGLCRIRGVFELNTKLLAGLSYSMNLVQSFSQHKQRAPQHRSWLMLFIRKTINGGAQCNAEYAMGDILDPFWMALFLFTLGFKVVESHQGKMIKSIESIWLECVS